MIEDLTRAEYEAVLRQDFTTFAARCFHELNPQAELAMDWHIEVIAAALTAVPEGKIRRLIINLPPGHLKSLMASVAFPAWCLCHDPSAQLLCYAGGCYECGIALKQSRARSAGRARPAAGGSARVASPRLFNLGFFDDRATAFVVERPSLRDRKFVDSLLEGAGFDKVAIPCHPPRSVYRGIKEFAAAHRSRDGRAASPCRYRGRASRSVNIPQ